MFPGPGNNFCLDSVAVAQYNTIQYNTTKYNPKTAEKNFNTKADLLQSEFFCLQKPTNPQHRDVCGFFVNTFRADLLNF